VRSSSSDYEVNLAEGVTGGAWLDPEPLALRCDVYGLGPLGHARSVRLHELRVEPRPGPLGGAVLWRAVWLALVVALVSLLVGVAEEAFWPGHRGRALRVSAVAALAGGAVVSWAHHDPWGLAFWIPPLPTVLTLLALVAVLRATRAARARLGRSRWPGLVLLAAAQGLFFLTQWHAMGVVMAILGMALLTLDVAPAAPPRERSWTGAVLLLVLLLALGLRLHRIQEIPFGMWRDEARHGLVALRILDDPSYRPIYVAERDPKINLPGFGFHLLAPGIAFFGINPWSMRVVTALGGALTVLPAFFLARRLFGGLAAAFLGAFFLACSFWHLILSRWAFATVFDPLFAVAGFALLAWALEQPMPSLRVSGLAVAGLLLGLAVQTYHSGRVAPVVGACLLFLLPRGPSRRAGSVLAFTGGLGLALLPLLAWAAGHRAEFGDRVSEVSLLTQAPQRGEAPLAALDQSLLAHLLMFNVRGDPQVHHNLPGHPMLDAVSGFAFLVGMTAMVRRRAEAPSAFVLAALLLGLLPSLLALDGPNGMRAVAAIVPACLIAGVGGHALLQLVPGRLRLPVLVVGASAVALLNAHVYFVRRPVVTRAWKEMYPVDTAMGVFIGSGGPHAAETPSPFHVPEEVAQESVLRFLTHGTEVRTFDRRGRTSGPWREGDWFLLPVHDPRLVGLEAALGPDPRPDHVGPPFPGTRTPSFLGYRARRSSPRGNAPADP
jgi:4-amino-4-deoxy-L-arabinose transferase-like glycosyltransferase